MKWTRTLATRLFAKFPMLTRVWLATRRQAVEADVPWAPLRKPLPECTLVVITTGGVHLAEQPAFDMADPDGDPSFRVLPDDTPPASLRITHEYYDARDARRDFNLVYPLQRLRELVAAGRLAGLARAHVGLMGHVDGRHVATLRTLTAPAIATLVRGLPADVALLVPA